MDPQATCKLNSAGGKIKRVLYITFDNVHFRRDNPNVPSDLEQMPNLRNFIRQKGTLSINHHTPLISHTADDILTALTGVYGERHGSPISNSFGIFKKDNTAAVFQTSFVYWTTNTAQSHPEAGENLPVLLNENGKNTPAPWPVFTRAGCDVGSFSLNGLGIENKTDITNIFGSTVAASAQNQDYLGVAIHCAKGSELCNNSYAKADLLTDEPGGYNGFSALYGNINVQPVISPDGPVKDLDGVVITDPYSNKPGFPTDFDPSAAASLGYAATMLEAGVPVVYTYISDAYDRQRDDVPNSPDKTSFAAYGPGEAGYVARLKAYDKAFGQFFARLKADGIDENNTLFVVVPDENDHFAGAGLVPSGCDGVKTPCTYAKLGEVSADLPTLLSTLRSNTTPFDLHSDTAPNFYIRGNPGQTDTVTRQLETDTGAIKVTNPISGMTETINAYIADQAEMKLLHMVTSSAQRTPNFTMFAKPDYYVNTSKYSTYHDNCVTTPPSSPVYEDPCFAWMHGDVQKDITTTWMGMVGPGVRNLGEDNEIWSDHTDVRPTILALVSLKDDYIEDGRVVVERLHPHAVPSLQGEAAFEYAALATVYKMLNAPLGTLGRASLQNANKAVLGSNTDYAFYLSSLNEFTAKRDALAGKMKAALFGAAFNGAPLDRNEASRWTQKATDMIEDMRKRAASSNW